MTYFFLESSKISSLILFSIFLSVIILLLSYLLSVSVPDIEKLSSYECGFDPYVNAKSVLNLRCYLVAILPPCF
jgi:NADH-quinone oxidoreductase subunit A